MKISILTSDRNHPVVPFLEHWVLDKTKEHHTVSLAFDKKDLDGGDVLFLISCGQILNRSDRSAFDASYVVHASDLPRGRGWSPHIWNIINGNNEVTVSLLEASDVLDSGNIVKKTKFILNGDELLDEINEKLFFVELELMNYVVDDFKNISPVPQSGESGRHLPRRTPEDSRLDIDRTVREQFNLLRTVDNDQYPAFFEYLGRKYILKIEKAVDE